MQLPWSSRIVCLLDVQASSVTLEFASRGSAGYVSLGATIIKTTPVADGLQNWTHVVGAIKHELAAHPQFHPQEIICMMHAPLASLREITTHRTLPEGTITEAHIEALRTEAHAALTDIRETDQRVVVHEYASHYSVNGYAVSEPRGLTGTELGMTLVETTLSRETHASFIEPLQAACGVPVQCIHFVEGLLIYLRSLPETPRSFSLVELTATRSEKTTVLDMHIVRGTEMSITFSACMKSAYGAAQLSEEEFDRSLTLFAQGSLEESKALKIKTGIRSAADTLLNALQADDTDGIPTLLLVPTARILAARTILADIRSRERAGSYPVTLVETGDMVHIASVVGL